MDLKALTDAAALRHQGLNLQPGQKILDSHTGDVGEIISGTVQLRPVKAAIPVAPSVGVPLFAVPTVETVAVYTIHLMNGETIERERGDLVALPNGVHADLEDFTL